MTKYILLILFITLSASFVFLQCNLCDSTIFLRDFNKKYNISTNLRRYKKGKRAIVLNKGTIYRFYLRESKRLYYNSKSWFIKSLKAENTILYKD